MVKLNILLTKKKFIIYLHNKICDNIKEKVYDNLADINDNITKFSDFKKILIDFLNHNPLINFNSYKKKV